MKKRSDGRLRKKITYKGKEIYIYGRSKKELDENVYAKMQELESNREVRENPTMNQFHEKWEEARRGSVKEATIKKQSFQYEACAAVRIKSAGVKFGEMKLKEIRVDDIREIQKALQPERKSQTVNDIIAHLSHIFHDAVLERRIDFNPCAPVKPLKRTEPKARDTIHRALTQEELKTFFVEAEKSFYYDVYRLALETGMRAGEIGALENADIHGGFIHITKTITRSEAGGYMIGDTPKTEHGLRQIPVNDTIREIIDHQKSINRLLDGKVVSIHDRIFKAPERGLLVIFPIDREIVRICKRAGIEPFSMHAFRATFATNCIAAGVNPKTLQDLLGHANFNLTMSLYGHTMDESKIDAMEKLQQLKKAL